MFPWMIQQTPAASADPATVWMLKEMKKALNRELKKASKKEEEEKKKKDGGDKKDGKISVRRVFEHFAVLTFLSPIIGPLYLYILISVTRSLLEQLHTVIK